MATLTLDSTQQLILDTINNYGATTKREVAEFVLDCEPMMHERKAIQAGCEALLAAGMLEDDEDALDITEAGRALAFKF